jgi:hypothetical protein
MVAHKELANECCKGFRIFEETTMPGSRQYLVFGIREQPCGARAAG